MNNESTWEMGHIARETILREYFDTFSTLLKYKWEIVFKYMKSTSGTTAPWWDREIWISTHYLYYDKATETEAKNVIKHQVSHALYPVPDDPRIDNRQAHDSIWYNRCAPVLNIVDEGDHRVSFADDFDKYLLKCEHGCTAILRNIRSNVDGQRCSNCHTSLLFYDMW